MKLENVILDGIKIPIIYEYESKTQLVNVKFVFKNAGKIANKIPGISNFMAQILEEGCDESFNEKLEIKGIELNIHSGDESFGIEISALKEHFGFALSMLKELLNKPDFRAKTFELVKTKIKGAISTKKSDFDYQAKCILNAQIYKNTAFEYPLIGDEQSIEKIQISDLKEFFKDNLTLNNLFITLGGNVSIDELDLSGICLEKGSKNHAYKPFEILENSNITSLKLPSEQAYIYFAAPFEVSKNERFKAKVATFILGSSGFGSRLMEEIRVKRGLAYSAYAHNTFSLYKNGVFGYLQTKNENEQKAIKLVKEIFADFIKKGVSEDELKSAKSFLLGSEPLHKETLFKRLAIAENEYYLGYELGHFDENLQKIQALSLDDLNAFIATHTELNKLTFAVVHG